MSGDYKIIAHQGIIFIKIITQIKNFEKVGILSTQPFSIFGSDIVR